MPGFRLAAIFAVSTIAAAQVASAADLPLKAPAPQAPAVAPVSGYLELYTGGAWDSDSFTNAFAFLPDLSFHGWVLGGAGRANIWAAQNISVQLDLQADSTQYSVPSQLLAPGFNGHFSTVSYLAGGHANWRDPHTGLLGIFGAFGDTSGNISTGSFSNNGVRHGLIGAEGQLYWNALTLYGQGGYDSTVGSSNIAFINGAHAWFLRGTGRFFVDPNLMLEGTAQYASGTIEHVFSVPADQDFTLWQWRAKVEWKPSGMPVSLFAAYEGSRTSYGLGPSATTDEKVTDNRAVVGVRVLLGENTLLAMDRSGASTDIIDTLGAPTSPLMLFANGQQFFVSDARLKRDITLVGRLDNGLGLYRYRYLWSDTVYEGVMAQEVALIRPDAVVHGLDGYLRVDYGRLGLHLMQVSERPQPMADARL